MNKGQKNSEEGLLLLLIGHGQIRACVVIITLRQLSNEFQTLWPRYGKMLPP